MNKKLAIISATALLATLTLTGCGADDSTPTDENFKAFLLDKGVLEYQVLPDQLENLMDYGRFTCEKIDEGASRDTLLSNAIYVSTELGDSYLTAFLAASMAGTTFYCPEYADIWDD
jgi:hypothetical protein